MTFYLYLLFMMATPFHSLCQRGNDMGVKWSGATWTTEGCPEGKCSGVHRFSVPTMTALHSSASPKSEGTPQVASEARGNKANFAWVQHYIHHLSPQTALRDSTSLQIPANPQFVSEAKDNIAGFVLSNGSMSSNQFVEGDIRTRL